MFGSIYSRIRECEKHGWIQSGHGDTCCQPCMRERWAEEAESPAGYDFGELREDIDELLTEEEWAPSQSDYGPTT